MTNLAMFRKKHEQVFQVTKYFGYDYIVWHMLQAAVRYSFCALVIAACFVVFDAERFFYNVNLEGLTATLKRWVGYYLIGLAVYMIISGVVYHMRYRKARICMLQYSSMLRKLARRFGYPDGEQDHE